MLMPLKGKCGALTAFPDVPSQGPETDRLSSAARHADRHPLARAHDPALNCKRVRIGDVIGAIGIAIDLRFITPSTFQEVERHYDFAATSSFTAPKYQSRLPRCWRATTT